MTNNCIKALHSSYASPMVCVRKKDWKHGSMRLCIDYRELNKNSQPYKMPIPKIQDIFDNLGGQKYFSKLIFQ